MRNLWMKIGLPDGLFEKTMMRVSAISPKSHKGILLVGLVSEVGFLALASIDLWQKTPPFLSIALAIAFLVLLPGWIASLILIKDFSLSYVVLVGFSILGGLILGSQFLAFRSVYPSLIVHLGWQVLAIGWLIKRDKIPTLALPPKSHWILVGLSMGLMAVFAAILNSANRLDVYDQWYHIRNAAVMAQNIGVQTSISSRSSLSAGDALNAWLVILTGTPSFVLIGQVWPIIVLGLVVATAYSNVSLLTKNSILAVTAAWLAMFTLVTTSGAPYSDPQTLGHTLTIEMVGSDKWTALFLLAPIGVVILVQQLDQPLGGRSLIVGLLSVIGPTLFHPQSLTFIAWVLALYLVASLVLEKQARLARSIVLGLCLSILLLFIPIVYSHFYQGLAPLTGSVGSLDVGLHLYVAINADLFIPNPALLVAPLFLIPILLTLLRGLRQSDTFHRLLFSWVWAVAIIYIPPFANLADRLWYPVYLDRFAWTLPFGALTAVGLWHLFRQRIRLYITGLVALTIALVPVSRIGPNDLDPRHNQYPTVDGDMIDLLSFFSDARAPASVAISRLPGPQTLLSSEAVIQAPVYGFPDNEILFTTPWWGTKILKHYIINQVNWVIVERDSVILPQLVLQPNRYRLAFENVGYLVYQVLPELQISPIDDLIDKLETPAQIESQQLDILQAKEPFSNVIIGLAYRAVGKCDKALTLLESAARTAPSARRPYLEVAVGCGQRDIVRKAASDWKSDTTLVSTMLSDPVISLLDQPTLEMVVHNWLNRPIYHRNDLASERSVATILAARTGRVDLATQVLRQIPDFLYTDTDWLKLAHWAVLAGTPDPQLYIRGGRSDLAHLLEGHLILPHDLGKAKTYYQMAVRESGSPTAYLFLGQVCETLRDYPCAKESFGTVANMGNEPEALYGAAALEKVQLTLGESAAQTRELITHIAKVFSLTVPLAGHAPVIVPLIPGNMLSNVEVSGHWSEPPSSQWPTTRPLAVNLTNPLPEGTTIYANLGVGGESNQSLAAYVPEATTLTWTTNLDIPVPASTQLPLRQIIIGKDGVSAVLADLPAWLPPRVNMEDGVHPLATYGSALQLLDARPTYDLGQLSLTLTWLPLASLDNRYTLYIHVFDASGNMIAQFDGPPFDQDYPTDHWLTNYAIQTRQSLQVDKQSLKIHIGWYLASTGAHLPLLGDSTGNGEYVLSWTPPNADK